MTLQENRETARWQIRQRVHSISVLALLECAVEIASALEEFGQTAHQNTVSVPLLLAKTRQISVALRKIILDSNGVMLKRCIENPELHPLKAPRVDAKTLRAKQTFEEQEFILAYADGSSKAVKVPAHDYVVLVHSLFGIDHESENKTVLTIPFDLSAKTVKFSKWMKTRILEINDMQFDVRSVLHLMAVNEGAHANERLSMMGPVLPDGDNAARYSAIDGIKFGIFSYMQFFTLFVGLYLINRLRGAFTPGELASIDSHAEEMCRLIHQYPRDFPLIMHSTVSIASNPLYVLGKGDELVGDYSRATSTTMRIPRA